MVEQLGSEPKEPQPLSYADINRIHDGEFVLLRLAHPERSEPYPDGFVVTHGKSYEVVIRALPSAKAIPEDEMYTIIKANAAHAGLQNPPNTPVLERPPYLR